MKQNGSSLKTIFVEVFSIVLGVMLALGVSEWAQQQDRREQALVALENVAGELHWNLDTLTRVHDNNIETMALIDSDEDDEQRSIVPAIMLRETAYNTLLSTGIANYLDYQLVLSLSSAYSKQGVYKQIGQQITFAAMNMAGYATANSSEIENENFKRQFRPWFEMLVMAETQLLDSYTQTLTTLEAASE